MKKIISILGARPQFIKAAVLSRIIREKNEFEEVIVHTGQHFDANMSDVFFEEMEIPRPKYNLDIHSLTHGAMTGQMLEKIETILIEEGPDAVVVYGDTNSTLAGALAAKKLGLKLVHVESGLRSFNMAMPEEVNRILTDRISDLLLCPTGMAMVNLRAEGFDHFPCKVVQCGDIMKDSVQYYGQLSSSRSGIIRKLNLQDKYFVLATLHRQENTEDPLKLNSIIGALNALTEDCEVILPLHPRTKGALGQFSIDFKGTLIDPLGYFDMLEILKHCRMVVTDSGGLQKEAFFNKKPCIIVRDETEWVELIEHGYARTCGSNQDKIIEAYRFFTNHAPLYDQHLYGENPGESIYREIHEIIH